MESRAGLSRLMLPALCLLETAWEAGSVRSSGGAVCGRLERLLEERQVSRWSLGRGWLLPLDRGMEPA